MKKLLLIFFILNCLTLNAQTYVDQWGFANYLGWPILNDSTTLAGVASMGDSTKDGWASIRGSFGQTIEAGLDSALIVSGQLELLGGGLGLTWNTGIRYALTWQEDEGILENQYTDSAAWSVSGSHYGYLFTPGSGPDFPRSGAGGEGTVWTIVNGNWASTYSNNGWAIANAHQIPYPSEIVEGLYNWAISIQPQDDGTNEVRWYMISQDSTSYWYGGIAIDTAQVTTKFKGICFAIGPFVAEDLIQFNLTNVKVYKGDPVEIPEAPFQNFYIKEWGLADYHGWPILNDSSTVQGNAGIGGETRDGWASIRGSFGQDISITTEKAILVNGQIEFIGGSGGSDYTAFRYALTQQADEGELLFIGTDSMQWSVNGEHTGYGFHPRTGTAVMSNGNGGRGTLRSVYNGNWASAYTGRPLAAINQAPRDAEIVAGVYDFAISVHVIDDSTNEIRWFMAEENDKYWFGGKVQGEASTTVFNGIEFGINGGTYTGFNVSDMMVDLGDPLQTPPQCWCEEGYVEKWGIIGDRFAGWETIQGEMIGNVSIAGESPNLGIVAVRGQFFDSSFPLNDGSAIIVKGELELQGGGLEAANSLRFGLFNTNNPGILITEPPDSMRWTGSNDEHSGYLFIPPTGINNLVSWGSSAESASWGAIVNNVWFDTQAKDNYPLGHTMQYPENSIAGEGIYKFQISLLKLDENSREIRFMLLKDDESYGFAGFAIDDKILINTENFNYISFALDSGNTITAVHLRDVKIELGNPIELPEWVTTVQEPGAEVAVKFSLSQNFPNPFNPLTHIKYTIPYYSDVSLKVFNQLGQEITTLFGGYQKAGSYIVTFDGSGLSSGVYYYRLISGDVVKSRKFLLLK